MTVESGQQKPSETAYDVAQQRLYDKPISYGVDPGMLLEVGAARAQRELDKVNEIAGQALAIVDEEGAGDTSPREKMFEAARTAAAIALGVRTVSAQGEM